VNQRALRSTTRGGLKGLAAALLALSCAAAVPARGSEAPAGLAEAVKGLRSASAEVRAASERAVLEAGLPAVREVVAAAGSSRGREAGVRVIAKMGPAAVPVLLSLLDDAEVRLKAGGILFDVIDPRSADLAPELLSCAAAKPEVMNYCGEALVKVLTPKASRHTEMLVKAIGSKESAVRKYAAAGLGRIGGKKAVAALAQALGDRDAAVRLTAAAVLGRLGREARSAVPALNEASARDDNEAVRRQAKEAVEQIDG
jgi:HEAT repeat protein